MKYAFKGWERRQIRPGPTSTNRAVNNRSTLMSWPRKSTKYTKSDSLKFRGLRAFVCFVAAKERACDAERRPALQATPDHGVADRDHSGCALSGVFLTPGVPSGSSSDCI